MSIPSGGKALTRNRWPDLSSRQLRAVQAVAEYRSFVAAAVALRMSQPALTRAIQQVEQSLGVPLFSRTTRQVSVTPAGKEFTALAERVLNDFKISLSGLRELADRERGQIVVASVVSLADAALAVLVAGYASRFPGIEIHLREGLLDAVRDDVRAGVADFGIGYLDGLPDAFIAEPIRAESFRLVLRKDHPLAHKKRLQVRELADQPLVSFPLESHTRRVTDAAAGRKGIALRYAITTNRLATLLDLVRNRVGLAVVPASERPPANDRVLLSIPLAGEGLACKLGLLHLRDRELSPAARSFMDIVRQWRGAD